MHESFQLASSTEIITMFKSIIYLISINGSNKSKYSLAQHEIQRLSLKTQTVHRHYNMNTPRVVTVCPNWQAATETVTRGQTEQSQFGQKQLSVMQHCSVAFVDWLIQLASSDKINDNHP